MSGRALAAIVVAAAAGCFSGRPLPGAYHCSVAAHLCPAGYVCNLATNSCDAPDGGSGGGGGGGSGGGDGGVVSGDVGSNCTVGGECLTGNCDNGICELATGPPSWRPLTDMFFQRQRPAVLLLADGTLMAAGGGNPANPVNTSVEQYLPSSNTWQDISGSSTTQSLMMFSNQAAAPGLLNGTIFIAGGLGNEQKLQKFDNAAKTFSAVGTTTGYFIDQAGSAVVANQLYVFGGYSTATTVGGIAERFDGTSWTSLGKITPRRALAGAVGPDGLIYALGGHGDSSNDTTLDTVETYVPSMNEWVPAKTKLPQPLEDLAAVTGPDGRLYILGGVSGGTTLQTVQALTPSRGRWAQVHKMSTARSGLGAVVGADGLIYAIGGADDSSPPVLLNSSEVYGPLVVTSGATILSSSNNFAANANVSVYDGVGTSGTVLATGTTDSGGGLVGSLVLSSPSLAPGSHVVTVMDDRSRFPVQTTVTIPPP